MDAVEITVNIKLQQNRWMITRSSCICCTRKTDTQQIKRINESINRTNRIILTNKIFKMIGKKQPLFPINTFNETLHQISPAHKRTITDSHVSTHPRPTADIGELVCRY